MNTENNSNYSFDYSYNNNIKLQDNLNGTGFAVNPTAVAPSASRPLQSSSSVPLSSESPSSLTCPSIIDSLEDSSSSQTPLPQVRKRGRRPKDAPPQPPSDRIVKAIRNRQTAQESRERRKKYLESLETNFHLLEQQNKMLLNRLDSLEAKNAELSRQLADLTTSHNQSLSSVQSTTIINNDTTSTHTQNTLISNSTLSSSPVSFVDLANQSNIRIPSGIKPSFANLTNSMLSQMMNNSNKKIKMNKNLEVLNMAQASPSSVMMICGQQQSKKQTASAVSCSKMLMKIHSAKTLQNHFLNMKRSWIQQKEKRMIICFIRMLMKVYGQNCVLLIEEMRKRVKQEEGNMKHKRLNY